MSYFGHLHTHLKFSAIDGMAEVDQTVQKAARLKQPFMAITDHGNMAAAVDFYTACRSLDVEPLIGVEAYLADPDHEGELDGNVNRFHLGLVAKDLKGYVGLVQMVSRTHTRPRFSRFPRFTLQDLAELGNDYGKHIILTTGCFFGLVQQRLVNEGPDEAERVIKAYAQWFPYTYVELQNHGIEHVKDDGGVEYVSKSFKNDDDITDCLYDMAMSMGLPVVCTQDSHYLNAKDKPAHALMKRMVYSSQEDGFPGDSFHFSTADWVRKHHTEQAWASSEESMEDIFNMAKLRIPELEKFKAHVPSLARNAELVLQRRCETALSMYIAAFSKAKQKRYRDRLAYELDVIAHVGMANYFLLVRKVVDFCEQKEICIETRGSGNGSLVLFLQGVTQVDPIMWNTDFNRFLSKDRVKMPDVDLDVQDDRRGEVIAFMAREWDIMRIGTWSKMGTYTDDYGDEKGSVVVTYMQYLRRLTDNETKEEAERKGWTKAKMEEISKGRFNERYGHINGLKEIRDLSEEDYQALLILLNMDSVYKSYGVHPGGILIAPDDVDLFELIPTMLIASSETTASQFDMDAVEKFGALKLDLLGQSSLQVMRRCQELMGRKNPNDFTWISYGDNDAHKLLREGRPDNGIFHFEGYSKAKGGKELGVRSVHDAIVATALYMPAAVNSGQKDRFIRARRTASYRERLKQEALNVHPIFEEELRDTNWLVVYQEQPLNILRALGMTEANINMTYKVLKDSGRGSAGRNAERLKAIREEFDLLCDQNGITDHDVAWHYVAGYDVYGFNRAHATGYGIRSYRTAYLKAHYPLEYMTALLQVWAGRKVGKKDKEALYVRDARRIGLRLLPPDVNVSGPSWTLDRVSAKGGAIRKGLVSVPGIGPAVAEAISSYAPFKSIDDLAIRVRVGNRQLPGAKLWIEHQKMGGAFAKLDEAGALESLTELEEG